MRLNFSESHVVVFKQVREDKYLKNICTFTDADGNGCYIGKKCMKIG